VKAKPTTKIAKHVFRAGDTRSHRGPDCARCPLPRTHDVHNFQPTSPEARAYDAAVLGEPEEDD